MCPFDTNFWYCRSFPDQGINLYDKEMYYPPMENEQCSIEWETYLRQKCFSVWLAPFDFPSLSPLDLSQSFSHCSCQFKATATARGCQLKMLKLKVLRKWNSIAFWFELQSSWNLRMLYISENWSWFPSTSDPSHLSSSSLMSALVVVTLLVMFPCLPLPPCSDLLIPGLSGDCDPN